MIEAFRIGVVEFKQQLKSAWSLHWKELPMKNGPSSLEIDWDRLAAMEWSDLLFIYKAVEKTITLGYVLVTVSPHIQHRRDYFGYVQALWVNKKHKGKKVGTVLLNAVEKKLKDKNIAYLQLGSNSLNPLDEFANKRGYEQQETVYLKRL